MGTQQHFHHVDMTLARCSHQRSCSLLSHNATSTQSSFSCKATNDKALLQITAKSYSTHIVLQIHLRFVLQQHVNNVRMPIVRCQHQRGESILHSEIGPSTVTGLCSQTESGNGRPGVSNKQSRMLLTWFCQSTCAWYLNSRPTTSL